MHKALPGFQACSTIGDCANKESGILGGWIGISIDVPRNTDPYSG
jgi:hypothetical protein